MDKKEIIARLYFYTKLGWGNYIAWWLGAIAYLTIIYELALKQLIPASPFAYAMIFIGIMLASLLLGYIMRHKGVYGIESKINAESSPYKDIPLGQKEILGYQNSIAAIEREVWNYAVQIEICRKLGLDMQILILKENMANAERLKSQLKKMLNKAMA